MRRPKSHGDFCALDVVVQDSDSEENGVVFVERRGTLSKDIGDVDNVGGDDVATSTSPPLRRPLSNLTTIIAHLNTLGVMVAVQLFTFVFVATMTDALHVLAGVVAIINFTMSLSILILRVYARQSVWTTMSTMGLYMTFPSFVVSIIIYVVTLPSSFFRA